MIVPMNHQTTQMRARALEIEPHDAILASRNRRSENIRILAIIIAELEFGNIERHLVVAHLVESANHTALEDRPEPFDGLQQDRTCSQI